MDDSDVLTVKPMCGEVDGLDQQNLWWGAGEVMNVGESQATAELKIDDNVNNASFQFYSWMRRLRTFGINEHKLRKPKNCS